MLLKKFVGILLFLLMAVGCGNSPADANAEIDRMIEELDHGDDIVAESGDVFFHEMDTVDKSWVHPNGFGYSGSGYGCFDADANYPGGWCSAPATKTWTARVYNDGTDLVWWNDIVNSETVAVKDRLNSVGWDVSIVTSGTPGLEVRTGGVSPSGYLGTADQYGWTVYDVEKGDYKVYTKCVATLWKTTIEANWAYQAASPYFRKLYTRNLTDHELMHCAGVPHTSGTSNLLMSQTYSYPGVWFNSNLSPTAAEIQMLTNFDPIN